MKRIRRLVGAAVVTVLALTGCAQTGVSKSEDATQDNPIVLALAHNLNQAHVTSQALDMFADNVAQASQGRIQVRIYPNGQLGSEVEVLEQLMAGVVDMTRVGAPGLATYNRGYHAFGLPFLFEDQDHYYQAMGSQAMRGFFESSADDGFISLTYFTSGARSFYTIDKPIREPADLKGLKIRVQDMRSQTDMMRALGGTPVVMPFGDTYTALQTGMIDGAESNETVLTLSKHGEVTKVFSMTEHTMIPDMLVISTRTWQRLSPQDQQLLIEAAIDATEWHKAAWAESISQAVTEAEAMGVEFVTDVDRAAFQDATASLVSEYAEEFPDVGTVLQVIDSER